MTDITKKLALVKAQCEKHRYGCDNCPFVYNRYNCRIKEITYELVKTAPANWDIEYIRSVLDGCD